MTRTNQSMWMSAAAVALTLWACSTASAVVVYVESGGQVVIEGEVFTSRTVVPVTLDSWTIVPTENAGAGPAATNVRGAGYVQSLPDGSGGGGGQGNAPFVTYDMKIATPGTYTLYLRWDGNATDATTQGQSDSIFADIVQLKDGAGGAVADHYEFNHTIDGNFSTTPWDNQGGFELNTAGGTPKVAANFNITAPGTYSLRVSQREDGSTVDAAVFQLSSLAAPAGFGAAPSLLTEHIQVAALAPTADAFVQLGAATTNFGNDSNIVIKDAGTGSTTRKGYLQFSLAGVDLDKLNNAQLDLEVSVNNGGGSPAGPPQEFIVQVHGLTDESLDAWAEGGINWNNAPGNVLANNTLDPTKTTLLGRFAVPGIDPTTTIDPVLVGFNNLLSSTPDAFLDFLKSDTNGLVSLILVRQGGGGGPNLAFFSSEATAGQGPVLRIFSAVPEPTTGLLGVLGLALLARRRRAA